MVTQTNVLYYYAVCDSHTRNIAFVAIVLIEVRKIEAKFRFLMVFLNALACSKAKYIFGIGDKRLCLLC